MWRHRCSADWRRSYTYGRAPNAIDILLGSLTWPSYTFMGRRGSWGGGVSGTPSPWIFKIYISENNIFSVIRGVFACAFQKFQARFVRLLWYLFMYVLSPPFNDLAYTFFIFAEQPNPRRISQYTPTLVNVSKYGVRSSGGRVVKLLACGARGPGFDSRPRHSNFRDWLSPISKSRYGWNAAKATLILILQFNSSSKYGCSLQRIIKIVNFFISSKYNA